MNPSYRPDLVQLFDQTSLVLMPVTTRLSASVRVDSEPSVSTRGQIVSRVSKSRPDEYRSAATSNLERGFGSSPALRGSHVPEVRLSPSPFASAGTAGDCRADCVSTDTAEPASEARVLHAPTAIRSRSIASWCRITNFMVGYLTPIRWTTWTAIRNIISQTFARIHAGLLPVHFRKIHGDT